MIEAVLLPEQTPAILTTTEACSVHKTHSPLPIYCETHHVIPRAWQRLWQPPKPWPFGGVYSAFGVKEELWDARTVPVCRTGHGNVHVWIVALMHAWTPGSDIASLATRIRAVGDRPGRADLAIAEEALIRFEVAGGDLGQLVAAGCWGQI